MKLTRPLIRRLSGVGVILVGIVVAVALLAPAHHGTPAAPAVTPPLPRHPPRTPPRAWLGLDYNSNSGIGRLDEFSRRGIIYDREGSLEVSAGSTAGPVTSLGHGLKRSYGAGMIPDVEVDPHAGPLGCAHDPQPIKYCLPTNAADVSAYVSGFVRTATSVRASFPHRRVLFEPMNEPWDWPSPAGSASGRDGAAEYATLLARLLVAAAGARVPLSDIYVQATGRLSDGSSWIPDLYAAEPCLRPGPGTCGPIEGWSVHPYGPPGSTTDGIDSVPLLRGQMLSGRSNVVVTEIGFCADDVQDGASCAENLSDIVGSSEHAARWLAQTLNAAAAMHAQGWLRALLVWRRGGGGWAMQNPDGTLTAQGRELDLFAASRLAR